jgi:acetyltransferase-like isoleucine patch superfamily enzyme
MVSGNVTIGERSWIGTGATIREGIRIGDRSFVGAGAVVVKDIPSDTLAFGTPARPVRQITESDWSDLT